MMDKAIIINNVDNNQNENNQNDDNINYIKATECEYKNYLAENEKTIYEKFLNKGCCGSGSNKMTITLLVYSIIIIVFVVAGFFFRISNNEGYKEYKNELENDLKLVDTNIPDDSEIQSVINFYNILKEYNIISNNYVSNNYYNNYDYYPYNYNDYDSKDLTNCSYEYFRLGICSWGSYRHYCSYGRYINNTCNFIDFIVFYNGVFNCTFEHYSNNFCSYQQYIDNKTGYLDNYIYYGGKPKRIDIIISDNYADNYDEEEEKIIIKNLYGVSFFQFWCDIGKYDSYLFFSLAIIMIIFIILIIIDLCIPKDNISNGFFYYIILICYMIIYLVIRIFICLLFL